MFIIPYWGKIYLIKKISMKIVKEMILPMETRFQEAVEKSDVKGMYDIFNDSVELLGYLMYNCNGDREQLYLMCIFWCVRASNCLMEWGEDYNSVYGSAKYNKFLHYQAEIADEIDKTVLDVVRNEL